MPRDFQFGFFIMLEGFLLPGIMIYIQDSVWVLIVVVGVLVLMSFFVVLLLTRGIFVFDRYDILFAVVLLAAGIVCHSLAGEPALDAKYGIYHSFSHIFLMLSIFFILESKDGKDWIKKFCFPKSAQKKEKEKCAV